MPQRRPLVALVGLLAVVAVGLVDYAVGTEISFAAFYVLVIVGVTVVGGTGAGLLAAVASAVVWGVAEAATNPHEPALWTQAVNGVMRGVVNVIVVVLVASVLRARDAARASEARSRASEARSRAFLATAAHQLRTPVAALGTSVEALLLETSEQDREALLANIATESGRLGRLVASLLRTARLDQGEALRPVAIDIAALCETELDRARQLSALEWNLEYGPDAPRKVVLDPLATSESLGNLLDNASRHAVSAVTVRIAGDRMHLRIEVSDDGPGLPSGSEVRAFERFVSLDGQGGTGLGLAIARELAHRQGGDLTYDEKRFVLTLPRVDVGSNAAGVSVLPPVHTG
jgi:signal transduction histidine kinase